MFFGIALIACFTVAGLGEAAAQGGEGAAPPAKPLEEIVFFRLPLLGELVDQRFRQEQLGGSDRSTTGQLIRSPSSLLLLGREARDQLEIGVLVPDIAMLFNSELPHSLNEDYLWAGRGLSLKVTGGIAMRTRAISLVLAPQVVTTQNREFQLIPYPEGRTPPRSPYASPWYYPPESLDRPQRFGTRPLQQATLGQSSLTVELGPVAVGAAAENLWWGPGRINALVMSNNAPGIPHLFLRTSRPLESPLGTIEGMWMLGALRGSEYFAAGRTPDRRSISGLALVLHPSVEPNLALGFARAVYATPDGDPLLMDALNVFRDVGRPATEAARGEPPGNADQIFSLFGRWVFPASGVELYGEWGRTERPASLRDFLVAPHHTQGYTLGLQWVSPVGESGDLALAVEASNLELSSTYRSRPIVSWYTSAAVPEGFTNDGRVVGAAIGPGSSSQWGSADFIQPKWSIGVYGGRVRWDNGVFYTRSRFPTFHGHDVSLHTGIRGSLDFRDVLVTADVGGFARYNYLFQHFATSIAEIESVDIVNYSLRLGVGRTFGP